MKLLIDIGNTATKFGALDSDFLFLGRCFNSEISEDKLDALLSKDNIEEIYVSSVAPKITEQLSAYFNKKYRLDIKEFSVNNLSNLKIKIDNKNELGLDLYFDLVGAVNKYQSPLLIVDMGTASKILLITKDNVFNSCVILPGMGISKRILNEATELLPNTDLDEVKKLSESRNTIDVINSSVYYAHVEMINGLLERYENEIGYKCLHIFTGGNAPKVLKDIKAPYIYDENLCLEGLSIYVEKKEEK